MLSLKLGTLLYTMGAHMFIVREMKCNQLMTQRTETMQRVKQHYRQTLIKFDIIL